MMNERIKLIRKELGLTQAEVAKRMNIKQNAYSYIESGRSGLNERNILSICDIFGVNKKWIETGEGAKFKNKSLETNAVPITENKGEFFVENTNGAKFYDLGNNKFRMTVPLVPYCAYARFANEAETLEADREEWETESFIVDEVVHGKYFAFEIKSDSMDDGTRNSFEEGDRVLARELNRSHWVDGFRYKKRPYWVIVFDNSVLIKQIISQDLEKGTITCHSLNDSPEYTDFTLELDKIRRIYYVVQKKPKTINF